MLGNKYLFIKDEYSTLGCIILLVCQLLDVLEVKWPNFWAFFFFFVCLLLRNDFLDFFGGFNLWSFKSYVYLLSDEYLSVDNNYLQLTKSSVFWLLMTEDAWIIRLLGLSYCLISCIYAFLFEYEAIANNDNSLFSLRLIIFFSMNCEELAICSLLLHYKYYYISLK